MDTPNQAKIDPEVFRSWAANWRERDDNYDWDTLVRNYGLKAVALLLMEIHWRFAEEGEGTLPVCLFDLSGLIHQMAPPWQMGGFAMDYCGGDDE